ncbi:MAG: translocation/assembly module TamB domain-containing protein [Bacteroidales bacterium]
MNYICKTNKKQTGIKKRYKISGILIFIFIGIPLILYGIFRLPPVQRWISTKISTYLSEKLNTVVKLEGIDISIFDHLIFEKLYLEDQQKDTLLYAEYLGVNIDKIKIGKELVSLHKIKLKNLLFDLKYDTAGVMNLQFILDAFASTTPDTTTSESDWKIKCDRIIIENAAFGYFVPDSNKVEYGFNFNDFKISKINLNAKNLMIAGNSIMLDVDSLSFEDKCGFRVKKLSSNIFYGNTRLDLNKFGLLTDNSQVYFEKLKLTYPSLDAFDDFMNKVNINLLMSDSTVFGMKDAGYFEPTLKGFDMKINMMANIKGTMNNLEARKIDLAYGRNTRLTTNFTVKGLSDIEKAVFSIKIDTLKTSITDLSSIKDPANQKKKLINLPESIDNIGKIYYNGTIKGKLSDIVTRGKLVTGLGNIDANINVVERKNGNTNIFGNLIGNDLSISSFINDNQLGKFDIRDTLDFNITRDGNVEGVSNGRINNLEYLGYRYQSVTFDAIVNKYVYQGELKIADPNIQLDFEGMFVNNDTLPKVKFTTNIAKFIPYKLHLYSDSLFSTKLKVTGSVFGLDPDVLTGKINLNIEDLKNSGGNFKNKKISVIADYDIIDSIRSFQILSDFIDVKFWGDIKPTTIASSFEKLLYLQMPSLADTLKNPVITNTDSLYNAFEKQNNFDYEIKLKDLSAVSKMFFPGINIATGTSVKGKYNLKPGNFRMEGYFPEINVDGTIIQDITLNADNFDDRLNFYLNTQRIYLSQTNTLDNTLLHAYTQNKKLNIELLWNSFLDSLNYSGNFSMVADIENRKDASPLIKVQLDSSDFSFLDNKWIISSNNILIDTNFIDLGRIVALSNHNEKVAIGGIISNRMTDTLRIDFNKIKLESFNPFLDESGLTLKGVLYGKTQIVDVLGSPQVNSNDSIKDLQINEHSLGDIRTIAEWDNLNSILTLNAETQLVNTKNLILAGKYFVKDDKLDFNAEVNRFPFAMVTPFVQEYISDIDGKISGNLKIKGTTSEPDISARLKFIRAGFKVNYIQTVYSFTDSLFIENNQIRIDKVQLNAGRNSYAYLSGKITHKNFDNIKLDISLDAHNFLFLKTQETDSSDFYGTVYASGGINLRGDPENMDINIKLKTEKGTRFFLPLTASSEVSESSYIKFVDRDTSELEVKDEQHVDLSGININFELEATSDAEMQIIMDETVGDMIKVRGMGNLDIKVNTVGDVFLFGTYTITKGDYLFTLKNLVNKKFIVDPGSTLRWNGDPYNAGLDLTAVYKIRKVSLFDLMQDQNYKEQKTNVECNLMMKGSLNEPRIDFGLMLPDAKEPVLSNINALAQDDLNQQILSLLILGKFQPLPSVQSTDDAAGGGALSNNAFEMLSNQLSNWLSKISDDFDIGVNYKQGTEVSSDEVEVALSTQLFNERVSINANAGVGGSNSTSSTKTQGNPNKIVGDVEIEVKMNKKGTLRSKAFNRTNERNEDNPDKGLYTQGVGVFYRKEFTTLGELFTGFWKTITFQNKKKKKDNLKKKSNSEAVKEEEDQNKSVDPVENNENEIKN